MKYLFTGISGSGKNNAIHCLGALASVFGVIGIIDTPVRDLISAARYLKTSVTLARLVVRGNDLLGVLRVIYSIPGV